MKLALLFSLCGIVLVGCNSDPPKKHDPTPPGFVAEETPSGPVVYLRGDVDGPNARLEVVARDIPRGIHGMAFRLRWDPEQLTFVDARGSDAWSKQALTLAKEGMPGELVVTWTEKGFGPGTDAHENTILGFLDFTMRTSERATVAFRSGRSMLQDAHGEPIAVEWIGGHVSPR